MIKREKKGVTKRTGYTLAYKNSIHYIHIEEDKGNGYLRNGSVHRRINGMLLQEKGNDIDRAVSEVEKNNLMFVHGLFDGIGSSRENGTATNNFILDNYKL